MIDEINDLLMRHNASGTAAAERKRRSDLMQSHFGTVSKTMIEETMPLFDLRTGYESLHQELEGKPSRYARGAVSGRPKPTPAEELQDEIPEHGRVKAKPESEKPKTVKGGPLADIPNLKSEARLPQFSE